MNELIGTPSEIKFTVTIKRKATGLVETYDMVGHVLPNPETEVKEDDHERDSLHSG